MEIDGYVYNLHASAAGNVLILARALDASSHVVAQKLARVHGTVPALSQSYFKVSALPPAPQYRVTVWALDTIDTPGVPRRSFERSVGRPGQLNRTDVDLVEPPIARVVSGDFTRYEGRSWVINVST